MKRLRLAFFGVVIAVVCSVLPDTAQAYPPRLPFTAVPDNQVLQPTSGQSIFTIRHACPGAARVLVNGVGYKAVNASRGYGSFSFGPMKPGKYTVTVKSCSEEATSIIYVPGALIIPQKHIVQRRLAIYIRYLPPGSVVSFLLAGKRVTTVAPVRPGTNGVARLLLPGATLKLGKNAVAFTVGTRIKISAQILGINAPK